MENASKALIIAGAILISIVLITLGVVIINQGQNVVNSTNIDSEQISTFNQKFTQYEGTAVPGANVNALINAVTSTNAVSNKNNDYERLIMINFEGTDQATNQYSIKVGEKEYNGSKQSSKATTGKLYKVVCTPGDSGYINTVTITKNP